MSRGPKPKERTPEYLEQRRRLRREAAARSRKKNRDSYLKKRARYREKHRDTLRLRSKIYYASDPDAARRRTEAWVNKSPEWKCRWGMLASARRRARDRNLDCNLTMKDIVLPTKCPVLGVPFDLSGGTMGDWTPTLDRVDVRLGYIKGNVCVISNRANRLKSDASVEEVTAILKYMRSRLTGTPS